jgi:hypothetical protein
MALVVAGGPAPSAHADSDVGPTTTRSWYGTVPAIVDVAAGGVMIAGLSRDEDPGFIFLGAASASAIAAPLVHLRNGENRKALTSFGLRAGLPALTVGLAFAAGAWSPCHSERGCDNDIYVYGMVGWAVAAFIDLARSSRVVEPPPAKAAWAPLISVTPDGASAGFAATF